MGFKAFDPNVEISGGIVLAFVQCTNRETILPILERHHMHDVQPEKWYPTQDWLDVLTEVVTSGEGMFDLLSIGKRIADLSPLPPTIRTIEEALPFLELSYGAVHRNGYAGQIAVQRVSECEYNIDHHTPWPDDLMYGAAYGIAQRYLTDRSKLHVYSNMNEQVRYPKIDDPHLILNVRW